jgi:hypothetical protein
MSRAKVLASITILFVIAATVVAMIRGPLYARYSATECLDAYAEARNQMDSAHVDLHPYRPPNGSSLDHRCGEVRAVRADRAADILSR